jgi:hypothetical protein
MSTHGINECERQARQKLKKTQEESFLESQMSCFQLKIRAANSRSEDSEEDQRFEEEMERQNGATNRKNYTADEAWEIT